MKRKFIKLIILILSFTLAVFSINAAINKHQKQDLKAVIDDGEIELLENTIIIDSLSEETDTEDYTSLKNSFEEIESDKGQILFVDNLIDETSQNIETNDINPTESIISQLRQNDDRWHYSYYKIQKGDNLWIIAKKFKIDHKLLIQVNSINNPKMLKPGKTIKIPNKNGIYYTIKKGDTLSEICSKYKVNPKTVAIHNSIKLNKIYTGKRIFLPDAKKIVRPKPVVNKIKSNPSDNIKPDEIQTESKGKTISKDNTVESKKTFYWPLSGKITSGFGIRKHPVLKTKKFHCGIDIGAKKGTPVLAAKKGKVIFSGWKGGYGKLVVIEHENNYITVYAHLSELLVKKGDNVDLKQKIALSGATGVVTGPHLHFEVRKYLTPLNPINFLR